MQQSTEPESQQHKDYGPRTLGRDPKYSPVTAEKHREQEEEANLDPLIYNQLGWTYVGHGDWDTSEDTHPHNMAVSQKRTQNGSTNGDAIMTRT